MKGIILAGGEGKRLQPLTFGVPKPLILIKEKPLINYNLALFKRHGVHDVKIIIRPKDGEHYERWYKEYENGFPNIKIDLVCEPAPMGTLGYLFHYLRDWMGEEDIFVTNGDDIKNIDLKKMLKFHREAGAAATLALMHMEKPEEYGAVLVSRGKIKSFLEKQASLPAGLVSAGMYVLSPTAIERAAAAIQKEKRFLMFEKDLFPVLAKENRLGAFVCKGTFFDCGTPERLERAIREA